MPQLCRLTEKETELKEQGSMKLQEWNKALTPLQEWFVKSEQKLESLENLESNMNNLKRQNQEYLVCLCTIYNMSGRVVSDIHLKNDLKNDLSYEFIGEVILKINVV